MVLNELNIGTLKLTTVDNEYFDIKQCLGSGWSGWPGWVHSPNIKNGKKHVQIQGNTCQTASIPAFFKCEWIIDKRKFQ